MEYLSGHRNVIQINEAYFLRASKERSDHEIWISMEYCSSGSLGDLFFTETEQEPLPESWIAYMCREILLVRLI
ncbi:hypothetical protein GDO86_010796 [Hymenochirus boettgeri]|uniref:Protein kinase domain-containing protein n=1 Tax=Hymenochirus boettgeri TaxID=247094 RepID=A0A8T2JBP3_9PIPI|nr:hypothetical protein GDO86_010796 [Hymenochirus boettgeri]